MHRPAFPGVLLVAAFAFPAGASAATSPYPATLDLPNDAAPFETFSITRFRESEPDTGLGNRLGTNVDILGDIDGDGVDDFAFYSNSFVEELRGTARTRIVFGGEALGRERVVEYSTAPGAETNGFRSISVDRAIRLRALGDVNGEGLADFGGTFGRTFAEGTFITYGRQDLASDGDTTVEAIADTFIGSLPDALGFGDGSRSSNQFPNAAGDLNGDGLEDVVVGDIEVDTGDGANANAGAIVVIHGRAGGLGERVDPAALDGRDGFVLDGVRTNQRFGSIAEPAGDFDGDGIDDLVIGSRDTASWLLYGTGDRRPSRFDSPTPPVASPGCQPSPGIRMRRAATPPRRGASGTAGTTQALAGWWPDTSGAGRGGASERFSRTATRSRPARFAR